ncbi:hypothetical protein [Variovorax sp. PAMC26660]|uniref:hypothetical protein n=1 Tax=Variovorax sp. PAMC26660 TaxID=2762322 RepID=UPI00164CFDF4|nr:hypothetical protein [Variovorax sp. PAMC26660]QNK66067.1 hypothetical protein H7F35_23080 [Variovorax sp. PAMC26660]
MAVANPLDEQGRAMFFPGARAPDPSAHREAMFQHYVRIAAINVGYARWAAGELAKSCPDWHGDVLDRLDADLAVRGIKHPPPFREPECKVPALQKGRRGLPKRKYFHDTP